MVLSRGLAFWRALSKAAKTNVLVTCSMPMFKNKIFPNSWKEVAATMLVEEAKRMRTSDPDDNKSSHCQIMASTNPQKIIAIHCSLTLQLTK